MSPKRIFNVCDYGAVGDGQYDIGTGTDNYAAIMACLTAIKASRYNFLHGGATMYFPQGMYRIYQQIPITFPVSIEGDGVGTVFPSTVIFGNDASDNEVGLFWLQTQGEAADGLVGSAGVSISRIGLAQSHPALQWGINANFRPGARATTARRTIPSPQGGGYRDVIWRCSVEGVIGKTEPLWPTDMTPARVYATGRVAINPDIVCAASPYEYTATVGGTSSGVPQGGRVANITVWAAGQAVTGHNPARGPGDYRRPTDAGWTGYYYEAQNTGLTAGAEPTWPTTLDGTVVDDGGVLWKLVSIKGENGQSIEKAQLLGRTVGQTTIDGTVTWTLTAKMPTVTDGDATWIPKFPTHGIVNHVASEVDDVWLGDINGDAMHYIASTGLATPTNINGSSARRIRMSTIAGHGLYLAGGDSNACYFEAFNITLTGGYGIYDASFLGNTHIGHQVDAGGRGAYSAAGPVEPSIWLGCYSAGGQPPSRILAPAIVLGGFHGAGFTTDSTARIISGKEQGFTVRVERSQELWGYQNDLPFPHRVWALGEVCFENTPNTGAIYAHRVSAITTGISGSEQPTWNHTIGGNTLDSGVTWTNIGAQSMQAQLGDLAHDPHLWLSYHASTTKHAWKWVYREDPSFGNWPGQGWLAFTETSSDANTAIAVSTSQATEGPGNFALVGHHIYWRRGSSLSDATTLPFTEAERDAKTTTDAT